tara:strand:- start:484 stop:789 length:306 start_codon:yes stop_codon:yes gene_type:complete
MWQRFCKWWTIDHVVDLVMDLILLFWEVITSPVLIVMRLIRWTLGKYVIEGLKNKIKKLIHWLKTKPIWVTLMILPIAIIILFYIMVAIWLGGEMLKLENW